MPSITRSGGSQVKGLREIVLINDLHKQGLSISAIARKVGCDRKTVRKYLELGLEAPVYGPRQPRARVIEPFERYLRERILSFPDLSGARLLREIREIGYEGGYTAVTDFLREVRPPKQAQFERRFETPPGQQAQVDFAEFAVEFTDEPGIARKVWLFSMVLGHSRWLWGRFVSSQNLQSVLRCHIAAFAAMGGVPEEILYDRMKTAVIGEDAAGVVTYNASLVALLNHYGAVPGRASPIGRGRKARSSGPSAISGRTSSWRAASGTWTISMPSSTRGAPKWRTRAFTPRPAVSSTRPSQRKDPASGRCRPSLTAPF